MEYLLVYFGSAAVAVVATAWVIRLACRSNIMDAPGIRKVHSRPIPRIGGVAIFLAAMMFIVPVLLTGTGRNAAGQVRVRLAVLLVAASFMFMVGFVDDIRPLRARVKLLAQIAAALIVCSAGIRIDSIRVTNFLSLEFGRLSWPVTVFWIVGLTNAINFIDGLDGLAAGICIAACSVVAVLSLYFGPSLMTVMMLALMGSLSGFLFYNFNPAKIFMGDSGSLFLGFVMGSASVLCAAKTETFVGLALPLLTMGVPVFDTLFCIIRRFLERRSVFSADRSHFHHRLLALGLRQRHAVLVTYGVTVVAAGLGMFMLVTRDSQTLIIFVGIVVLLVLAFRAVGAVRLRETMNALKHKYSVAKQQRLEKQHFEEIELYFQQAVVFDQWWRAVCFASQKLGFITSLLPLVNRDGSKRLLSWTRNGAEIVSGDLVKVTVAIPDRRSASALNLEVQVCAAGSLESAGRRIALLGRLLERYSVAALPRSTRSPARLQYQTTA